MGKGVSGGGMTSKEKGRQSSGPLGVGPEQLVDLELPPTFVLETRRMGWLPGSGNQEQL
jgi:hypothetical protein